VCAICGYVDCMCVTRRDCYRWKCLLWYLPNVPPNHGMLQRVRPEPMAKVQLGSSGLQALDPQKDLELRSQTSQNNLQSSALDEADGLNSPTPSGADSSGATTPTGSAQSTPRGKAVAVAFPEQLVTTRDDVFELFDKDGSGSALYVYSAKQLASQ
jgi:hypothetical protein